MFVPDMLKKAFVKSRLIFTFFVVIIVTIKNFRVLWNTHIYLFITVDNKLCVSLRFFKATYYFQWNPLLLLNIFSNAIWNWFHWLISLWSGNICWTATFEQYTTSIIRDFPPTKQKRHMFCWNILFWKFTTSKRTSHLISLKSKFLIISS